MIPLLEDLTDIEEKAQGLVENKVANFAYTQEAYDTDDVAGVSEYNVENNQNIPVADAETLDVNPTVLNKGYRSQASSITRMLMNHFLGRISYNLNKSIDLFKKGFLGIKNALGKPNGIATLDDEGYLSNEQVKPVLAKEKLKEFLFSGKEFITKDLTDGRAEVLNIFSAHSVNAKEDVIIYSDVFTFGTARRISFVVCKYDGDVATEIARLTLSSADVIFDGSYKHYDLFHVNLSNGISDYDIVFLQFNYNTMELSHFEMNVNTLYEISFNKSKGRWELINSVIRVNKASSNTSTTEVILKSVELDTFNVTETALYIPALELEASTSDTQIICIAYLSGSVLVLKSRNTYGSSYGLMYLMYVFHTNTLSSIGNIEATSSTYGLIEPNLLPRYGTSSVVRNGTKIGFVGKINVDSTDRTLFIVDNGNVYFTKISLLDSTPSYISALIINGDYSRIYANTLGGGVFQVFKNSVLCATILSIVSKMYPVYDSVFMVYDSTMPESNFLIDVENNARIIPEPDYISATNEIVKSNRRAYQIWWSKIREITNVLD